MNQAQRIAADLLAENLFLREQMRAALAVVEWQVDETCYSPEAMEYVQDEPCARCTLRELLNIPDTLAMDATTARSGSSSGAAA